MPKVEPKLVAWWKFDEVEGGNAGDSSGNNQKGQLEGGPQWQSAGGKTGGALEFDGIDDYIDCGSDISLNLTQGVSIAAWVNLAGPAIDQKIAGNQDNFSGGYKLGIYNDKAEFEIRDSGNVPTTNRFVEGGTILEPGTWYHIVGTYSQGGSLKTYVNAKLDKVQETLNILNPSSGTFIIGREPFLDLFWFNGLMDDLQIYSYPLSETEVATLYSGQTLPTMTAKAEILAASGDKPKTNNYWLLGLFVVVIAAVAIELTLRKGKTTA